MRRLAVARAQDQERILAEERVAADVLAAFDALEQERVVGVLGDLQERRHRRQQVGDDLLADRHERAAPRQFLELFKRRDFHRSMNSASFRSARRAHHAGRRLRAGPPLELLLRLRDQHVEAADRLRSPPPPPRAAAASSAGCRRGRRHSGPVSAAAGTGVCVDVRIHADRRAVDEQVPAARLRRPRPQRARRRRAPLRRAARVARVDA